MKICLVFGLWLGLLAVSGCDHAQEAPAPEKPQVVSKAISVPEPPPLTSQTAVDSPGGQTPPDPANASMTDERSKGAKAPEVSSDNTMAVTPPPVTEAQAKEEQALAETAGKDILLEQKDKYDTKGRVDPFVPLLTSREEAAKASADGDPARPKRLLTPLEKMDLSQIKLVAVIKMGNQTLAMVEEAGGKGYEVRIGTYMGRNGGRVSAIQQDKLLVREYYRDYQGNYQGKRKERIQELKFHRNEGGE